MILTEIFNSYICQMSQKGVILLNTYIYIYISILVKILILVGATKNQYSVSWTLSKIVKGQ